MKWNWDSTQWKTSTKVLLGFATIWPVLYMFLFLGAMFSMILFLPSAERQSKSTCGKLNVLQLDKKIKDGQIKELVIRSNQIIAKDREGTCEYETWVSEDSTREQILNDAKEMVGGRPRVEKIENNASQNEAPWFVPLGFGIVMIFHLLTMATMMGLLPLYIILAIKNDRLDQTMRIVWVVLACTVGMFANIVYWYLYIWKTPPAASTSPAGTVA